MSEMEKLKVAVIQLTSSNEIRENEILIVEALKRIEGAGVELVVFPENVWFMRLAEGEGFPDFRPAFFRDGGADDLNDFRTEYRPHFPGYFRRFP